MTGGACSRWDGWLSWAIEDQITGGGEGMASGQLDRVECIVVGSGVVGLACARELALSGREVLLLEAEGEIGKHSSGRNSEVIHAGIYYPPGSLKGTLCVEGKRLIYRYLAEKGIPHRRLGKLIVAPDSEDVATLRHYQRNGLANGVDDLQLLGQRQTRQLEPELKAAGSLLSPSTGILDSHAYMLALQGDFESAGGSLAFHAPVTKVGRNRGRFEVSVGQEGTYRLGCRELVNAAGLGAWQLARSIEGLDTNKIPPCCYAKGHYMTYSGRTPFGRLVYPVPQAGGLGVHLTLDTAGQARFGPDVVWTEQLDYRFEQQDITPFAEAIQQYWPDVVTACLQPGYVGIRPRVVGPGDGPGDFIIQGKQDHSIPGLVQLFGIESPGLTASLAIGSYVLNTLETQ